MTEEKIVLSKFEREYKQSDDIVIYGTGKYSKRIIEMFPDGIVGVYDESYSDNVFCGKHVFSKSELLLKRPLRIIIIARPMFHKEIYDRIKSVEDVGHVILNLNGKKIKNETEKTLSLRSRSPLDILKSYVSNKCDALIFDCIAESLKDVQIIDGKFEIKRIETLVEAIFAPYLLSYLSWLYDTVKDEECIIWFVARDGWFLSNIYDRYKHLIGENLPTGRYVLGSRRSFSVCSIRTWRDAEDVLNYREISGNQREILNKRFGIHDGDLPSSSDNCIGYREFESLIIKNAEKERNSYLDYLNTNKLLHKKVLFFELVTSGTGFHFAKKLLRDYNIELKLLCFQFFNSERQFEDTLEYSYLGEGNYYENKYLFPLIHELFEVLLSPSDGMFLFIDDNGIIHYEDSITESNRPRWENTIGVIQKECIDKMDSIVDKGFFELGICSKKFSDRILMLLLDSFSIIPDSIKDLFTETDSFRNVGEIHLWSSILDGMDISCLAD